MPELPEVEHVVRALRRVVVGRKIIASEVRLPKLIAPLSVSLFNSRIRNSTIRGVSRRGKFILIECQKPDSGVPSRAARPGGKGGQHPKAKPRGDQNLILAVHLRMTGKFVMLNTDDELPRHAHAIFYLDHDQRLVFRDQRQFGVMKLIESSALSQTKGIRELAPEPFGEEFSLEYLRALLKHSHRSLKTLLLDQTKVLGLGNIYAAEALFRAKINPFKPADELASRRVPQLYEAIREVLQFAVDHIRGSISLEEGFSYGAAFERFWQVYEREGEPCVKCGARIRRATHGGRSTYWCPKCQRR
jgi:formamidopyrimidine-DNA glycosylase